MASGPNVSHDVRAKAEAKFHLAERRKTEAEQALSDARVAKSAESAKTARLKALRIAKEETERESAEIAKASKAAAVVKKKPRVAKVATA